MTDATRAKNIPVADVPHAPFIYYEDACAFGHNAGVINITVSADRLSISQSGELQTTRTVVAHLRGNISAARSLRDALDKALLLAAPADEAKAN
jgi:hypothetical protein